MKMNVIKSCFFVTLVFVIFTHNVQMAMAADGSWTGTEDAVWTNSANWSVSPYPGSDTGESAFFNNSGNGNTIISIDGLFSIANISFSGSSLAAYTLGSGGANAEILTLEDGALIHQESTAGNSQTVNAALQLGTNAIAGVYEIQNDSTLYGLTIAGNLSGGSGGTAGTKTLTISGAGQTTVSGTIVDGGASNITVMTEGGTVTLANTGSTYSGPTWIRSGILEVDSIKNVGVASSLGQPTNAVDGAIRVSNGATHARLRYTGTGDTTDRAIEMTGTTGGLYLEQAGTGLLKFTSDVIDSGSGDKTLNLQGSSTGLGELAGSHGNGNSSANRLTKEGSGQWNLSGANSYAGITTINDGILMFTGMYGAISNTSAVTINTGATLLLNNTAAENNTNRLNDAADISLNGATLAFNHTGGVADYNETVGAVTLSGGATTISASQADVSQTSTLTLSSLSQQGSGTLDFSGTGLGVDNRNRIFITGQPDGMMGYWATYNGSGFAAYDSVKGVCQITETNIAARGPSSVIPDDPLLYARITSAGTSGPIDLAAGTTRIAALQQATDTPAVVDTATKTLRTSSLSIQPDQASFTIGISAEDGTLTALAAGGQLEVLNNSTNALVVNASITNNTSDSALVKNGAGDVILNGACSYTGPTLLNEGALFFGSDLPQTLAGIISGAGTLVKNGTNELYITGANTYTGPTYINEGVVRVEMDNTFGSTAGDVIVADGATLDVGTSRPHDTLNMRSQHITVRGAGVNGMGALVNSSASSQWNALGNITLEGDTTVGPISRFDFRDGTLVMNDHRLTTLGPDQFVLSGLNVIPGPEGNAGIDVLGGRFRLQYGVNLHGSETNIITVRDNARIEFYLNTVPHLWTLNLESNSTFFVYDSTASTHNRWAGPVSVDGIVTFTGPGPGNDVADIQGQITGNGSVVKTGLAYITFSGTNNTYSGSTSVTDSRLYCPSIRNVGEPCSLGQPMTPEDATILLGSGGTAGGIVYTGAGDTTDRAIGMSGSTGAAEVFADGSGLIKFITTPVITTAGNKFLTLRGSSSIGGEISANIANGSGSVISISKQDAGLWVLSGTNTFTGAVSVSGGELDLTGINSFTGDANIYGGGKLVLSGPLNQGSAYINIGNSSDNGIMILEPGLNLTGSGGIRIGNATSSSGALYMKGGTVNRTPVTYDSFFASRFANSYGYFNMSGGEMTITRIQTGASGSNAINSYGVVRMTGGTMTIPGFILLARGNDSTSAFTVEGGTINHVNSGNNLSLGYEGGSAELNMTGGTLENYGRSLVVNQSSYSGGATGIVNFCAGLLSANFVQNNAPGVALLNFAGGTLKAGTVDSSTFIPSTVTGVYSYGPFSTYAGGAVIDSAGRNITVAAPIQAPAGNGVTAITLSDQGSGYIGEPYVSLNGDGLGATAIANMEDDGTGNGTYRVSSITITCPGTGYTASPSVSFYGGGKNPVVPTVDSVTLAPNTSGGLTKIGAGTLTLGVANTYTGTTTVTEGTLKLGNAAALSSGSKVQLNGGTLDLNGYTVTNEVAGTGTIANGSLSAVLSPAGTGVIGTASLTLDGASLSGTYLLDVTTGGDSDLAVIDGDLDLSGLSVDLVDPGQLDRNQIYTILSCTGTRSGTLSVTNLPDSRWHLSYLSNGNVRLLFNQGTVIVIR